MHALFYLFIIIIIIIIIFRLAIHPSIHSSSIHFTTYRPFCPIYLQDMKKLRLWLGSQRIDSLTVSFSHPK